MTETNTNPIHIILKRLSGKWTVAGALFLIILGIAIGLRVYKAHNTGIIYDEVWTYEDYCTDFHTAVTKYTAENNHVLNSVFIVFTQKIFGSYEHFLRIPSLVFGILFCCSLAVIINKTIHSRLFKIVILAVILFNWFIVDLTFLARGYAIALGATFCGMAVILYR